MVDFDQVAESAPLDELARVLGAKKVGSGWLCPSPDHDDSNPSFSFFRDGSRTAGKCHGCGLKGSPVSLGSQVWGVPMPEAAERLARELGLFVPSANVNRTASQVVDVYDYVDEDGEILFQVLRFEHPKDFRQRHPCPKSRDGWHWSLGGGKCGCPRMRRVLYHLPRVVEAVALGKTVYVVEGEKDVHAVEEAGGVATCNPMGAGKWRQEYSGGLRGAHVIIVADRDEPGISHARQVAACLDGIASEVEIVRARDGKDAAEHFAAGHRLEDFDPFDAHTADTEGGDQADPSGGDVLPEIKIRQELGAVTNEAINAVVGRADLGVYIRSRMLVTISRDGAMRLRGIRRAPNAPVIVPIEEAMMLGILDRAATWKKFNGRTQEWVAARPPSWVAKQVLARLKWPFPYLEAVIETPTLRSDGTVLDRPGWDPNTGLLFEPDDGVRWPCVPDRPTEGDVQSAVRTLLDPVRDFPFVADSDRAAYVAVVLSIIGRHLIDGPVPAFPIRAPAPGTGKTLLAEIIGIMATGRTPAAMSHTYQTEEFRKRVHALAMDGTPIVLLENVSGSLGSDVLAGALTAREWRDRLLGKTQMVEAPLQAVWLMTGNNLAFKRTLGRRVVPIDLDARLETPEDRTEFKYANLRAHTLEVRPTLVVSALIILRGFHLAGRPPHDQPRMGSFEAWDDLVRSAVVWSGLEDPATTSEGQGRGRIRAQADDDLDALGNLLEGLAVRFPDAVPFSTSQVISAANTNQEFSDLLDAVAAPPKGGHATANSVGAKFRDHRDRPFGGLVLRRVSRTWKVERMEDEADAR